MTNSNQLNIGQLINALNQCDQNAPVQLVQVIHERGINYFVPANLVFVENTSKQYEHWNSVVYLHTETLDFIKKSDKDTVVEITEESENFANTIRENFIENI